jgi:Xaa-Pro aminopeptidase
MPNESVAGSYSVAVHGVGMCDEWPAVVYMRDWDESAYDGVFEPGMTICVESYIGVEGGLEGVKLEEQVLITENCIQRLSTFPYEDVLLA